MSLPSSPVDMTFCAALRDSRLMSEILKNSPRVSSYNTNEKQCPSGMKPIGNLSCLNVDDPIDVDANMFRCNLRCLNGASKKTDDSTTTNQIIVGQCRELGDATCKFAQVDCAKTMELAKVGGAATKSVIERSSTNTQCGGSLKQDIMASSFKKTQMMRELRDGASSGGRASTDAIHPDVVALGAEAKLRDFILPPNLNEEKREQFHNLLVEEMPMITSIHDRCCEGGQPPTEFGAAAARGEIDKIAAILGAMEMDKEYDPLQTCPGKNGDLISKRCPNL